MAFHFGSQRQQSVGRLTKEDTLSKGGRSNFTDVACARVPLPRNLENGATSSQWSLSGSPDALAVLRSHVLGAKESHGTVSSPSPGGLRRFRERSFSKKKKNGRQSTRSFVHSLELTWKWRMTSDPLDDYEIHYKQVVFHFHVSSGESD